MKNLLLCFTMFFIGCVTCVGQNIDPHVRTVHESDHLVVKFSEWEQDCSSCDRTPVRNVVRRVADGVMDVGVFAVDATKDSMCRARKMLNNTACRAKCATKKVMSRTRGFTKRLFSRKCCG